MTVYCLGSINMDWIYRLQHAPDAGETLAALDITKGLGGKGANQSVAAARAGAQVRHFGAVGSGGAAALDPMADTGIDVAGVAKLTGEVTGHALILLTPDGENRIIIHPGANRAIPDSVIDALLAAVNTGDFLLLQNETNGQAAAAKAAHEKGVRVAYSAAPFEIDALTAVLPHIDLLFLNEVEAAQTAEALGRPVAEIPVPELVVTKGADGASWLSPERGDHLDVPAPLVTPIDTTGAGDTFAGYFVAARDGGAEVKRAMGLAVHAAALQVTRPGASPAIPTMKDVLHFGAALP
ncbi:MAG: ribokinase [Pseudomonadota bacterium]